jgi:hypothetical protein
MSFGKIKYEKEDEKRRKRGKMQKKKAAWGKIRRKLKLKG